MSDNSFYLEISNSHKENLNSNLFLIYLWATYQFVRQKRKLSKCMGENSECLNKKLSPFFTIWFTNDKEMIKIVMRDKNSWMDSHDYLLYSSCWLPIVSPSRHKDTIYVLQWEVQGLRPRLEKCNHRGQLCQIFRSHPSPLNWLCTR